MGRQLNYPPQLDSPSKQLMLDLVKDLEELRLHNSELKKVKAYERRSFYETLDRIDHEREVQHNAALDHVAELQGQRREEAEETLRDHLRAEEEARRREEEEARQEKERVEREKAERLRREQDEAARKEAERKAQEEAKKKAAEEAEKARKTAQEEQERKQRERQEEEKRKHEAEAKKAEQDAAQRQENAQRQEQAEKQKQMGGGRQTSEENKAQLRYVELHRHLKSFRQYLKEQAKASPAVKQCMGDMRRSIKKSVGQLREGKGANKTQLQEIKATLEKAAAIPGPSVDIRQFVAFPPENIANSDGNTVPALLIYGLNIFSKALISSLITEASINQGHAEPIGIVAAQIFSQDAFIYNGCHLVDILWAKYRVICPALWGFYGDERTESGRRAVGWKKEGDGTFISEQGHIDRMTALGAGYAALTLRNFGKTPRKNPFPNQMFWYSMYKILSIPPDQLQETHISLLASMLRSSAERIVGFFGHVGLALMRKAIVDIPNTVPRQTMSVNQLRLLKDLYIREKSILI